MNCRSKAPVAAWPCAPPVIATLKATMSLNEPSEDEEDMLDQAFFVEDNSRLGCQIFMREELDGLTVRLAEESE